MAGQGLFLEVVGREDGVLLKDLPGKLGVSRSAVDSMTQSLKKQGLISVERGCCQGRPAVVRLSGGVG